MDQHDALVSAAVAGDPGAFGELWELLSPKVVGYLRGRGVADPDDVTSEVFLAAFTRIGDFVGDGRQFRRFLFTVAHHKSVDDIRRRFGPRVPQQVELTEAGDPRRAASAEDEALREVYGEQIQQLLASLPPVQREVLLLRVVTGLDVADVAAVVGRSEGAVKQLQHRALTSLRGQLAVGVARAPAVAGVAGTRPGATVTAAVRRPITGTT
jgi:RNA polymerase sigma factor (sigma-70 family)